MNLNKLFDRNRKIPKPYAFTALITLASVVLLVIYAENYFIGNKNIRSVQGLSIQNPQPTPTLSPSENRTPNPTYVPTPAPITTTKPSVKAEVKQQVIKQKPNDGSRTGNIVSYNEYCTGKQISVYENEKIVKVSTLDGKTYAMTQGDWDCYYSNNLKNNKPQNTNTTFISPTYNSGNNSQPLINCVINYPCTGNSYTYQFDEENCNRNKQQAIDICNSYQPAQPTPVPPSRSQVQGYCQSSISENNFDNSGSYMVAIATCMQSYGY